MFFKNNKKPYVKDAPEMPKVPISNDLTENLITLRSMCGNTADLIIRDMKVGDVDISLVMFEGLFDMELTSRSMTQPMAEQDFKTADELLSWFRGSVFISGNQFELYTITEVATLAMAGFVVVLIDGIDKAVAVGLQGFNFRSVAEPDQEVNVKGGKEGFVEPLRVNISMIRRRMRCPSLSVEFLSVGKGATTDLCLVYRRDRANINTVNKIRTRLQSISIDNILDVGYIQPFIDTAHLSLFSAVGNTERPDTLCAKVSEGRIGILVDGTPFALIVPYLFTENFQTLDDYTRRPYYGTFIRWIKYLAFFVSVLLPGLYVSVVSFDLDILPGALLAGFVDAQSKTPFPVMIEALCIYFVYELVVEAGLRIPKSVGHTVGIVGALVVGDAAVASGLVSLPLIIVVALTAVSSYVVPSLIEPVTMLRFGFIIVGGTLGIIGISLGLSAIFINICSLNSYGSAVSAPLSPFSLYAMRDVAVRMGWKELSRENLEVGAINTPKEGES